MKKLAALALIALLLIAFFAAGLDRVFTREFFLANHAAIQSATASHPWLAAAAYVLLYVVVTALSLPGATVLTLAGGAVFGLAAGVVMVSIASTLGATLAFLVSRHLLADWVRARLGARMKRIDAGFAREGAFYLFALRLVPAFPFWLVNLAMGLTRMRTLTYAWVSQLGMLPATIAYTYAGTQLGQWQISARLLLALAALGLLPLAARRVLDGLRARRVYARWKKPRRFDYNLVVIGAGSAGLVSAYIAAATRARVALVERHAMGGDCLNTGCVPSKALIRSARLAHDIARHAELGLAGTSSEIDFAAAMERVARVVAEVAPHDSVARYTALGVEVKQGEARITSPWTVEVKTAAGSETLTARGIVIATGGRPAVPAIPGIEHSGYLTSDTIWRLRQRPAALLVLGGGPVGCELALALARLGVRVRIVTRNPRLMPREDPEVGDLVRQRLEAAGIAVVTGQRPKSFGRDEAGQFMVADATDQRGGSVEVRHGFDALLVAVGREASTAGLGLADLGLATSHAGTVATDEHMLTSMPNIAAAGDVAGPWQFTHTAAHQAWYATVNTLFGSFRRFRQESRVIPWCTYLDPEVARVGLNEQEARAQGIAFEVVRYDMAELDRAITEGARCGWIKLLIEPGRDRVLGATVVSEHAGELIATWVLAIKHGLGLRQILGTIHVYPTWMEANKAVAGVWRRSRVTQGQNDFMAVFQAWRRGGASLLAVLAALPRLRDRRPIQNETHE